MTHRMIHISVAMLALSVAGVAGGQASNADSSASGAHAVAAAPKWFDLIALNAFVSSAYQYNGNRPSNGTNSYRVFDFNDNSFNLDVAELVVEIAATKQNDAGFRVDLADGNSIS